jgi:uncharacterized protein (DUF486 family)
LEIYLCIFCCFSCFYFNHKLIWLDYAHLGREHACRFICILPPHVKREGVNLFSGFFVGPSDVNVSTLKTEEFMVLNCIVVMLWILIFQQHRVANAVVVAMSLQRPLKPSYYDRNLLIMCNIYFIALLDYQAYLQLDLAKLNKNCINTKWI